MSSKRILLLLMGLASLFAWGELAILLKDSTPDPLANRLTFFGLLFVAVFLSSSLVAYALSFRLFLYKMYRGDLARAVLQALPVALFVDVCIYLNSLHYLNVVVFFMLLVVVLLAEYALIPKENVHDYGNRRLTDLPAAFVGAARRGAKSRTSKGSTKVSADDEVTEDDPKPKIIDLSKVRASKRKYQARDSKWKSKN